jgi:hypothetical protein
MKKRLLVLSFTLLLFLPTACAAEKSANKLQFHPPQTEAERALDAVLHTGGDANKGTITKGLLDVITKIEEKKKSGTCTGSEGVPDALLCEAVDSVLTCGAIFHDAYSYRTTSANDHEATVDAIWSKFVADRAARWSTYRLVKNEGIWALDGIDCGGLYKFNISVKELLDVFHLATSAPEKALDKIFHLYDKDKDLDGFIFNYPWHDRAKDKEFSLLFSRDFLNRSEKEEKSLIKESCGGKYPADGQPCDMIRDVNPIYCGQDYPDVFLYRTIKSNRKEAIVTYTWPIYMTDGPVYKLVHDKDHWMLDDIDCSGTKYDTK